MPPDANSPTITWLHLSDAHLGDPNHRWEADPILDALPSDLRTLQATHDLRPDLVFFTGDLAFGQLPNAPLREQYRLVDRFLEQVCASFDPPIPRENLFLVPGNHDVNRHSGCEELSYWLDAVTGDDGRKALDKVNRMLREGSTTWKRFMERLSDYRTFLEESGLHHLLDDKERLVYAVRRRIAGRDVGVAGLNTAWSAWRDREKGKLWLGGWQISTLIPQFKDCALTIALSHHPTSWLNEHEDPSLGRRIARSFDFHLHGHEHDDWVIVDDDHVRVAAGPCFDSMSKESVYNVVRLYPNERRAEVYLRQFDQKGGGWIPYSIFRKAPDGVWRLENERLFSRWVVPRVVPPPIPADAVPEPIVESSPRAGSAPTIDIFQFFSVAREIADLDRFIGRRAELEQGLSALRSQGASIAIFGHAGVGKTSLAIQLARVASGDHKDLLHRLDLRRYAPPGGFAHPVVYYCCRRDDRDIASVLLSLLQDCHPPFSIGSLLAHTAVQERLASPAYQGLAAQFRSLGGYLDGREAGHPPPLSAIAPLFKNITHLISEAFGGQSLVAVLDELNLVADKSGLAGMMKELHHVTFVIVGTAVDVRLLVQEHASVPRQLAEGQIRLHRMTPDELRSILKLEERKSGGMFRFDAAAAAAIVESSNGMPFFTHFLGRYALDEAIRAGSRGGDAKVIEVREEDVNAALARRLTGIADLDSIYLEIVPPDLARPAWQREFVLKLLAYREEESITLSNISPVAKTQGVERLTSYIKFLLDRNILEQMGERSYRFTDTRFKVFARLRPVICDDAQRRLEFLRTRLGSKDRREGGWVFPNSI